MPALSPWEIAGVLGAGVVAGTVNTVVGSGSLLTFPTLIAFGYAPRVANVSNTIGLVPGSVSGAIGYRRELPGQRERIRRLGLTSLLGGLVGASTFLLLPSGSFEKVVPFLVVLACVLVVLQPRLAARVAATERARLLAHEADTPGQPRVTRPQEQGLRLHATVFATAVYGGYFGAAQGVILIALLGIFIDDNLQRLNALKNVMTALINGIGAVVFVIFAPVAWLPVALLAAGATVGGQIGARVGRRLRPELLRALIVVVGLAVSVKLFWSW